MFNVHIGIPGIVPTLLESPELLQIIRKRNEADLIPNTRWHEKFRSVINREKDTDPATVAMWKSARLEIAALENQAKLTASQHALLGTTVEAFTKKRAFPKAEERLARLSEVFERNALTIHLTLTSQFEYLKLAMQRASDPSVIRQTNIVPSWSNLVSRIRKAAPECDIVVWDFEQPRKITTAFVVNVFGVTDEKLIADVHSWLAFNLPMPALSPSAGSSPDILTDYADSLDVQYDIDLDTISEMKNVTMIRAGSIPPEFFV